MAGYLCDVRRWAEEYDSDGRGCSARPRGGGGEEEEEARRGSRARTEGEIIVERKTEMEVVMGVRMGWEDNGDGCSGRATGGRRSTDWAEAEEGRSRGNGREELKTL